MAQTIYAHLTVYVIPAQTFQEKREKPMNSLNEIHKTRKSLVLVFIIISFLAYTLSLLTIPLVSSSQIPGKANLTGSLPVNSTLLNNSSKSGYLSDRNGTNVQEPVVPRGTVLEPSSNLIRAHQNETVNLSSLPQISKFLEQITSPTLYRKGIPSKGNVAVPVILVDFPDYPHTSEQNTLDVAEKFFGSGNPSLAPYESVNRYYSRSSYGALNITGDVYGWFTAPHPREYYKNFVDSNGKRIGDAELVREAVLWADSTGVDFSRYDNDNDGNIDGVIVKWTGPRDDGSFWWPYTMLDWGTITTVDGKLVRSYIWSPYTASLYATDPQLTDDIYRPITDLHEMGHLLGLPDYYDTEPSSPPFGGLGGWDMMDGSWGDENAFSKSLLGWVDPVVVSGGSQTILLRPSGTYPDAVIIGPDLTNSTYGEYFLVEYREPGNGNDPVKAGNPTLLSENTARDAFTTDGLWIYHVNSALNSENSNFLYNNGNTPLKLLSIVQADGQGQIERKRGNWGGKWDQNDFFVPGMAFGPFTNPGSATYNGNYTGVKIDNIEKVPEGISARFSIISQAEAELEERNTSQVVTENQNMTQTFLNTTEVVVPAENTTLLPPENPEVRSVVLAKGWNILEVPEKLEGETGNDISYTLIDPNGELALIYNPFNNQIIPTEDNSPIPISNGFWVYSNGATEIFLNSAKTNV